MTRLNQMPYDKGDTEGLWDFVNEFQRVAPSASDLADLEVLVTNLQSQADNKISAYVQATTPTWTDLDSNHIDDRWYNTVDLKWYAYNGATWVVSDSSIFDVASVANGKATVWYGTGNPDNGVGVNGDLYLQENAGNRSFWKKVAGVWQDAASFANGATKNIYKGAWSSASVDYVVGDVVTHQSSSWGCITAHTSQVSYAPPTLPTESDSRWVLIAASGNLDIPAYITETKVAGTRIESCAVFGNTIGTTGAWLTSSCAGGATTLNVDDTGLFASSGDGYIIDSTNTDDKFSWTGKTLTTLTGCSGVLAHNIRASVIPAEDCVVIDRNSNTMNYSAFVDTTAGYEVVAKVGPHTAYGYPFCARFGTMTPSDISISGVACYSYAGLGVNGVTTNGTGISGYATNTGAGLKGESTYGYGIVAVGRGLIGGSIGDKLPIRITPSNSASSPQGVISADVGALWVTSAGILYICTGAANWTKVGAQ